MFSQFKRRIVYLNKIICIDNTTKIRERNIEVILCKVTTLTLVYIFVLASLIVFLYFGKAGETASKAAAIIFFVINYGDLWKR